MKYERWETRKSMAWLRVQAKCTDERTGWVTRIKRRNEGIEAMIPYSSRGMTSKTACSFMACVLDCLTRILVPLECRIISGVRLAFVRQPKRPPPISATLYSHFLLSHLRREKSSILLSKLFSLPNLTQYWIFFCRSSTFDHKERERERERDFWDTRVEGLREPKT